MIIIRWGAEPCAGGYRVAKHWQTLAKPKLNFAGLLSSVSCFDAIMHQGPTRCLACSKYMTYDIYDRSCPEHGLLLRML